MRTFIKKILRESDWGWVRDFNPILEIGKWSIGYIDNLLKDGYKINFKYPNGTNPNTIYSIVNEYDGMYEVYWLFDGEEEETITYEKEDVISILNSLRDPWVVTSIEPKSTLKESSDFGWVDDVNDYNPADLLNNALGYESYGDKWKVSQDDSDRRLFSTLWFYKYNDNSGEYDPVTYFPLPNADWVDKSEHGTKITKDIDEFLRWVVSSLETQLRIGLDFAKEKNWSDNTVGMLRIKLKQELLNDLYDVGFNIKEGLNESDFGWYEDDYNLETIWDVLRGAFRNTRYGLKVCTIPDFYNVYDTTDGETYFSIRSSNVPKEEIDKESLEWLLEYISMEIPHPNTEYYEEYLDLYHTVENFIGYYLD